MRYTEAANRREKCELVQFNRVGIREPTGYYVVGFHKQVVTTQFIARRALIYRCLALGETINDVADDAGARASSAGQLSYTNDVFIWRIWIQSIHEEFLS